jgi:hypothetical protein
MTDPKKFPRKTQFAMISKVILHWRSRWKAPVLGLSALMVLASLCPERVVAQEKRNGISEWENSVVTLEVARKQYDYFQPWSKRTRRLMKTGIVVGERSILTTADEVYDRTLVRLQKGGRGRWSIGEVEWVDYPANLALITTSDETFWKGLKPAQLGGKVPADGNLQILRWREGKLEARRAEFTQYTVREGMLCPVSHVVLETGSEIQNTGWGEPLTANSHLVGILSAQNGRTCVAIPAGFIDSILKARKDGRFKGLGFFHFFWQQAENPALLASLKLPTEAQGVVVIDVPKRPDNCEEVIRTGDVILQIDGFDLDVQGDYIDPVYGPLMLENLATRKKWAGDDLNMEIWRDGKQIEVTYRLPKFEYPSSLVPWATYDQEPEYLVVGGLIFQPLNDPFLQSWGAEWKRRAPFRLLYYRGEQPTEERPALVLLSQVMPDAYNIGYQDLRGLVVDRVNGKKVSRLSDLRQALQEPKEGFHIIEFMKSDSLRKIVLAAGPSEEEATARVLKRYGISEQMRVTAKP